MVGLWVCGSYLRLPVAIVQNSVIPSAPFSVPFADVIAVIMPPFVVAWPVFVIRIRAVLCIRLYVVINNHIICLLPVLLYPYLFEYPPSELRWRRLTSLLSSSSFSHSDRFFQRLTTISCGQNPSLSIISAQSKYTINLADTLVLL